MSIKKSDSETKTKTLSLFVNLQKNIISNNN